MTKPATYSTRSKHTTNGMELWDPVRKKWIIAGPEEVVRQNLLAYLVNKIGYPMSLLQVEKAFTWNKMTKRFDALFYKDTEPILLIECKAPEVKLNQDVFLQIATYNLHFKVPYLLIHNGVDTFFFKVQADKSPQLQALDHILPWDKL